MPKYLTIRSRQLMLIGAVCLLAPTLLERAAARNESTAIGTTTRNSRQAAPVALEQVVVTATKQRETLQNTPVGLTVITSSRIRALGIKDFNDYMQYVPSLQISSEGGSGLGVPIIRGLYSGPEQTTSTVAVYLGDTPLTPSSAGFPGTLVMPDPNLADVRNIEVLKGPQGTLYGASSLGGLIRIVPAKPSFKHVSGEVGVSGSAVEGGGDGYGVHGWVNIPLIAHELALRVSAFDQLVPGFMTNVLIGCIEFDVEPVRGSKPQRRRSAVLTCRIDIALMSQDIRHESRNQLVECAHP